MTLSRVALPADDDTGPGGSTAPLQPIIVVPPTQRAFKPPRTCRKLAGQAVEAARAAGSSDVEMVALALEGLALVCVGAIDEGMRRLDAATASVVAGEVGDVDLAETICCYLIDACKRVRDLERAAEWCARVSEIASRFEDRFMFAVCRIPPLGHPGLGR